MPKIPEENFFPDLDGDRFKKIDNILKDLLTNPRGDFAIDIFRMTGVIDEGETLDDKTDEELEKYRQRVVDEIKASRDLQDRLLKKYGRDT